MLEFFKNKKILVVVAHPDDEILGIGGTINKLVENYSAQIKIVILGEGITSREAKDENTKLKLHNENILKAKEILKYQNLKTYNLPDNKFDSLPLLDVIKLIEFEKKDFKPEIVITHHGGDLNVDHRITFKSVMTAFRPLNKEICKMIMTFETLSGTEWIASSDPQNFIPNFFIELDEENIDSKIRAMESYEFEKRNFPHPRSPESIKNKAMMRGISIGSNFAEAFQIIRMIFN